MAGPLVGLKVLDLSQLLPGPFCSMLLADLGADVLKIEDPQVGDYMRWWGPRVKKYSAFFLMLNRNKIYSLRRFSYTRRTSRLFPGEVGGFQIVFSRFITFHIVEKNMGRINCILYKLNA